MSRRERWWLTVLAALLSPLGGCGDNSPPLFGATAVELGVLPQSERIQGRDGGPSGLAWGRSVWTFGDTVLAAADHRGSTWHHNSFSITDDLDASDNIGPFEDRPDAAGAPRPFIDSTVDEETFNVAHEGERCPVLPCHARWAVWPGAPVWDGSRGRALVFYGLIYAEPGEYNFRGVGSSVAVWTDIAAQPERPEVTPGAEHPTLLFGENEPSWGTAAVIDADQLYVFACSGDPFSPPCSLARVPPADVLDRGAWRFWDGAGWSSSMDERKTLFGGAPSVSVGYNAHLGAWAAIYARPLSNDIMIRTAPALMGPWSPAKLLFTATKQTGGGAYDANWHREYDEDGGRTVYVTFSRPTGVGWFGGEFALVRVVLP